MTICPGKFRPWTWNSVLITSVVGSRENRRNYLLLICFIELFIISWQFTTAPCTRLSPRTNDALFRSRERSKLKAIVYIYFEREVIALMMGNRRLSVVTVSLFSILCVVMLGAEFSTDSSEEEALRSATVEKGKTQWDLIHSKSKVFLLCLCVRAWTWTFFVHDGIE